MGRGSLTLALVLVATLAHAQQPPRIQSLTQLTDTLCPTNGQTVRRIGAGSGWECFSPGASTSDIESVGDCLSGACFNTSGTGNSLVFEGTVADADEVTLTAAEPSGDVTLTLPAETGTVCSTGSVCTGYQAGPLTGDVTTSGTASTIAANSVALGTDTTGNYAISSTEGGAATFPQTNNSTSCTSCTGSDITATGAVGYVDLTAVAVAHVIHGIAGGTDGQVLFVQTSGLFSATTFAHESSTDGTAGNRIITLTGASVTPPTSAPAILIYDGDASRWRLMTGYYARQYCDRFTVSDDSDNHAFWLGGPTAGVLLAAACSCNGTCTTMAQFQLEKNGTNLAISPPTCGTPSTNATWLAASTTQALAAGALVRWDNTQTSTTPGDEYVLCIQYLNASG